MRKLPESQKQFAGQQITTDRVQCPSFLGHNKLHEPQKLFASQHCTMNRIQCVRFSCLMNSPTHWKTMICNTNTLQDLPKPTMEFKHSCHIVQQSLLQHTPRHNLTSKW